MFALEALEPPPPPSAEVVVAAHDLLPGTALAGSDVRVARLPPALVPSNVFSTPRDVTGRVVTGAVRAGEPLTDVRVVSPGLVNGLEQGHVAMPIRLMDAATAALLRPGDIVDVVAVVGVDALGVTGAEESFDPPTAALPSAAVVAAGVRVLSVPQPGEGSVALDGALVVLSTSHQEALDLAAAAVSGPLSVVLLPDV